MGAVMSITGNVLGMDPILRTVLTYVEEVGTLGGDGSSMYVSQVEVVMSRMQLALNVDDLDQAVEFYSKLFNVAPAKRKPGYANFAVAEPPLKLVLLENPGQGGTINHLGVEVESSDTVHSEIARLSGEGLFTEEEINATCCFATQDKVWVTGPAGEKWEVYTVLADSDTFGTTPKLLETNHSPAEESGSACCGTTESAPVDAAAR
ncbi:catechol 2,3-dioxygenase-like lactoylglutathione lyase family enzyme [Williamsia limnetica]|jgi:catechol 2,3-dioxygenase-like lactoylglutathione lyase family enzyme|uniref:Catechol 2,3-dioxygenase-like lactoylglutathione lyase family enzyme n=2 Tax=Nocardiaceae TaxID=85025 RepID=A0A318RGZ4_WILLI|nr:catechol 2,3-dioxygenase-like lactoylglutathione lyase family enzyme [Williamsia limnetica]